MEEIIKKVYAEKLQDGSIEKIVANQFEKMTEEICKDLMGWNGSLKKQMEQKIEPLLSGLIEKSDFSDYSTKLTTIINEAVKNTSLGENKAVAEALNNLLNYKSSLNLFQEVKISDLFDEYVQFVQDKLYGSDIKDYIDDYEHYAYIDCFYNISEDDCEYKPSYFDSDDKYHIIFSNEKAEEDEEIARKTRIEFEIYKDFDGDYKIDMRNDFRISELSIFPAFILRLIDISNKYCTIVLDKRELSKTAEIEVEE